MSGTAAPSAAADRHWMEQALALAALGEGATSPNPRVGCVLVRDGALVGSGFHQAPGAAHAEQLALERAGERARGATVYVNLEPCAHQGRTPPCASRLVEAGVRRVVAALEDPHPLVAGRGLAALAAAGVGVELGLLAGEARRLDALFLHRHTTGRPLVTLKAGISLDARTAARGGRSRWITGPAARRFAHRLRLGHDAVLVGAATVRLDDPSLTVRLPGTAPVPRQRLVLAPSLDLDPRAALFTPRAGFPLPRLYAGPAAPGERERAFAGRAIVVRVSECAGGLALDEVLADLTALDVQSVLVEGGARTLGGFLAAGLADRAALFVARTLIGAGGTRPLFDFEGVSEPALGLRLVDLAQLAVGEEIALLGRVVPPAEARCSPA